MTTRRLPEGRLRSGTLASPTTKKARRPKPALRDKPELPSADKQAELTALLGLSPDQGLHLWDTIRSIVWTIERHADAGSKELDRKEMKAWLSRSVKLFEDLRRQLTSRSSSTTTKRLIRGAILPELAILLGHHGINILAKSPASFALEPREVGVELEEREIDLAAIDRAAIGQRVNVVTHIGPNVLFTLLDRLAAPLRRQLDLARLDRGGAPPRLYRNFLVKSLVPEFETLFGQPAKTGASSKFVGMCSYVFEALGLDDDGIEAAVERALRGIRSSRGENDPQNSKEFP